MRGEHFAFESIVHSSHFSYQQDISITILARAMKLGELIGALVLII